MKIILNNILIYFLQILLFQLGFVIYFAIIFILSFILLKLTFGWSTIWIILTYIFIGITLVKIILTPLILTMTSIEYLNHHYLGNYFLIGKYFWMYNGGLEPQLNLIEKLIIYFKIILMTFLVLINFYLFLDLIKLIIKNIKHIDRTLIDETNLYWIFSFILINLFYSFFITIKIPFLLFKKYNEKPGYY